jgi:Leucine-rich repeat (LRR) protein
MPHLTELDLECNIMDDLLPQIGNLHLLTALRISYNQLAAFPSQVARLSCLTLLEVSPFLLVEKRRGC